MQISILSMPKESVLRLILYQKTDIYTSLHKFGVKDYFFLITVESYNAIVRISSPPIRQNHFYLCLFLPATVLLHQRWDVRWWRLSASKSASSVLKKREPCFAWCFFFFNFPSLKVAPCRFSSLNCVTDTLHPLVRTHLGWRQQTSTPLVWL